MASLEDIASSLSARLKLLEGENKILKVDAQESRAIANRAILEHTATNSTPISILEPKASLPDKFDGTRRKFRGFINQLELVFQLQASRYDTDRKKIAMLGTLMTWKRTSMFYHGLSSEIKDALVHFDNPSSVSAAMDMAIRIDNRLFERRQEQRLYHQRSSFSHSSATPITSRFRHQLQQQRFLIPDNLQL
ncbi:hypothetical protein BASA50_004845 [Batrachochytrium salamandrivorans]|uniref:DUF4939 domain-containing protein n=1 Tax=Batrachochytrium salamandrivorans TaxID=1357716 RepID=A0ABQ8FHM3_9FUNG|nr:hypothetical protein BASA50_004845 [Batrachochytrium salamandrivorans]